MVREFDDDEDALLEESADNELCGCTTDSIDKFTHFLEKQLMKDWTAPVYWLVIHLF